MNKRMKNVIFLIALSLIFIFNSVFPVYANDDSAVTPYAVTQRGMMVAIDFDGNVGIAEGSVLADANTELLEGELYVYKSVNSRWIRVGSSYDSATSGRLTVSVEFDAESGVTYWAVFTVTETTAIEEFIESVDTEEVCP